MKKNLLGFYFKGYHNMSEVKSFKEDDCKELVSVYANDLSPQERYQIEINILSEYKTSIRDFTKWLKEVDEYDYFIYSLKELECGDTDVYDIASGYRIPVSMVKHFQKTA